MFSMADYWPFDLARTGDVRVFHYTCPDNPSVFVRSAFRFDRSTGSLLLEASSEQGRQSTWYLRHQPGFGVAEWRNDYPATGWGGRIFGGKRIVFSEPIGWGDRLAVGHEFANGPRVDMARSRGCLPARGRQWLRLEGHHATFTTANGASYGDVIQLVYRQRFGRKTDGARYWLARDVGPVALQWAAPRPDTGEIVESGRFDAVVS